MKRYIINGVAVLTDSKLSGFIGTKELLTLWGLSHACRVDAVVRQTEGNRVPPSLSEVSEVLFSMVDFPDNNDVNSEK